MANEHRNNELLEEQHFHDGKSSSNNIENINVMCRNETTVKTSESNSLVDIETNKNSFGDFSENSIKKSNDETQVVPTPTHGAVRKTGTAIVNSNEGAVLMNSTARSKLTDLVADVCLNGAHASVSDATKAASTTLPVGFGDCTNIRATLGVLDFSEGLSTRHTNLDNHNYVLSCSTGATNNTVHQQSQSPAQHAPTQNSSTFSFKHFLSSSSSSFTAPSTTVTSLDPICSIAASTTLSTASSTITASNEITQKSTGARPKVPQSASITIDSITSGRGGIANCTDAGQTNPGCSDNSGFGIGSTRMKRSPRFSSFDSQASLAEYASSGRGEDCVGGFGSNCGTNNFRLYALGSTETNSSSSAASASSLKRHLNSSTTSAHQTGFPAAPSNDSSQKQYVPRSYSNYEMPMSPSPRRRMADSVVNIAAGSSSNINRPNRLSLQATNAAKLKLDLPIDSAVANTLGPSDFQPAPAAALPDFVQDHWMDALYLHDLHLNSPRNSPTRDFSSREIDAAAVNPSWCDIGAVGGTGVCSNKPKNETGICGQSGNLGFRGQSAQVLGVSDDSNNDNGRGGMTTMTTSAVNNSTGASKMLPDFLSDGPIIHSSQRLADVAAGLPSNSVNSPEDPLITSHRLNLRNENERLQQELIEMRTALSEQTQRANNLERQLIEETRRRTTTPTAQQVLRLKQQLTEMAEEAEILRRENESLREEGAVGGFNDNTIGQRTESRFVRPVTSRSQQISQALLRAASNAENNLRQLLAGVDNLRQMAADIEDPGLRLDYDGNSDIFSDFLDDCEGFEDFSGGPAL